MKKLLGILSAMTISISSVSVTSCSLVNYEKQYIKNKVKSIVDISNVSLRAGILNDTTGINVDYLNQLIDNSKMSDMLSDYKGQEQTKVSELRASFLNQTYDRNFYTNLNQNSDLNLEGNFDPNTKYDSTLALMTMAISAIKSIGGIKPSLVGTLESILPLLTGSLDENTNYDFNINIDPQIINIIQLILNVLGESKLGEILFSIIFDINFIKFKKINMSYIIEFISSLFTSTFPQLLTQYINNIMFNDYKGSEPLTYAKIEQSSIIRVTNLLNNLANQPQAKPKDNWEKINISYIRSDLANALKNIINAIKNGESINTKALIPAIPDLIYIIASLVLKLGIVDFNKIKQPNDGQHLFSNDENNWDYISKLNKTTFDYQFNYKILINNLALATNPQDENGYNMQKMLMLLTYSNYTKRNNASPTFLPDENKGQAGWIAWFSQFAIPLLGPETAGSDSLLGALISAFGSILLDVVNINLPIPPSLAGTPVSKVLTVIVETLIFNQSLNGLNDLLDSFGVNLNLSNPDELKKPFNAIWNKNSSFLTDLTGIKINNKLLNLGNILSLNIIGNKTLSILLQEYYDSLDSYDPSNKWNNKFKQGINSLIEILNSDKKYKLEVNNQETEEMNLLNAFIKLSKYKQYGIRDEQGNIYYGSKGAMYLLGYNSKTVSFLENSVFSSLELMFDDTGLSNTLYSINEGLKNVADAKNLFINTKIMPYLDYKNFDYKISDYQNINSISEIGTIKYKIYYTDPFTNKKSTYLVNLQETEDKKFWNLISIKKQL